MTDLLGLGAVATSWGIVNPAAIPWRSAAALSHSALGDSAAARRLAGEEIGLARRWGAAGRSGSRCAPRGWPRAASAASSC